MPETIGVFVAWPYANGDLHLGHVAGVYIPADTFARYHRLRGNRVLMVSGSDAHGTPITVAAEREGVTPEDIFRRYHRRFLETYQQLGISFDLFTHTHTANHFRVAQDIFRTLYEKGYIFTQTQIQLYCEYDRRFLPDRYVEGTCPYCGYPNARGDQCDNCGRTLDAIDLIDPRCRLCGQRPVPRETEHFFFDLPAFTDRLLAYLERQTHWRPNVQHFVRNFIQDGLKPRPVSRDLEWGIPLPIPGYEHKVMYVWFEAVIGYLSASIEWSLAEGQPEVWQVWWRDPRARGYYFIGKDNIPFHAIIWPAELMGYDESLNLPYDIPANEFLNLEGQQFSTSRNWAIWVPDFLSRYAPDPLRDYLTSIAPETRDSEFTWQGFVERNNNELLATWGNLVHRILTFVQARFEGRVPEPGALDGRDHLLLDQIAAGFQRIGDLYARVELKAAQREALALAREVNRYLDEKAPWFQIREDRAAAATTLFVALRAIDSLKLLLAPILPFTSEQLHRLLGYRDRLFGDIVIEPGPETGGHEVLRYRPAASEGRDRWAPSELEAGRPLPPPQPLYQKLEESVIEEERQRLLAQSR
ncbi:methionine--tRNA ligase [Thermomicrobium sp.]|uniref:methionine--tRNA ligase n=1 Tax=Thermomicrobium sp. TaxID=1969469 RepID=UPI001B11185D|nr:methionine--tRNA ligase [Thermomicrobium sp.]MBO9307698.1 methionine--tRNA ligase [Thermomicrobium sp.]